MTASHEKGPVLYVVSRSGKVLDSQDCARRLSSADYFEGELEGWIFWGTKPTSGNPGSKRVVQDKSASFCSGEALLNGTFDSLCRPARKAKRPFVVQGDESSLNDDSISTLTRRQSRSQHKRAISRRERSLVRRFAEGRKFEDFEHGLSLSQSNSCCFERKNRLERNLKIGLAQLTILLKWEAGTREHAARWVAWLMKMLRKAKSHPRPLQHLLFTMCAAVLPVVCRSLTLETWASFPDPEVYKCADIFWSALEKSISCFSHIQWEILEEKMDECRKLRHEVASLLQKRSVQTSDFQETGDAQLRETEHKRSSWTRESQEKQEVCAKENARWSSPTHVCKKQKLERSWRCSICGSDGTSSQLTLDNVLLRIFEVRPKNMSQVLPNGRWRVIWSPVTERNGKRPGVCSLQSPCRQSTKARNSWLTFDPYSEAMKDCRARSNESQGCRCETEWQALDRAVKSWKEGLDRLSRGRSPLSQREKSLGRRNSISSRDGCWKSLTDTSASIRTERTSALSISTGNGKGERNACGEDAVATPKSIINDEGVSVLREMISKSTTFEHLSKKRSREDSAFHVVQSEDVLTEGPSATPVGMDETRGPITKLRVGQHKARRKQMAKKG